MEESVLALLKEGGGTVAVILVVLIFIKYISSRDNTISVHMENEIKTFGEMRDTFAEMRETNRSMHQTNQEMFEYFKGLNGHLKQKKKK